MKLFTSLTANVLLSVLAYVDADAALASGGDNDIFYLDVHPANTKSFLEALRKLPLSTYRLTNDQDRTRVGIIGQELARVIPDAVSFRTVQAKKNGEEPTTLRNFPSVNEPTVFMYSVGATQELAKLMDQIQIDTNDQMQRISDIHSEIGHFEQLLAMTTGGNSTLRMKEAASKAAIMKNEMEVQLLRAKHEQEHAEITRASEEEQLRKSEEMTLARIKREDEAARSAAERAMLSKFEASRRIERAKIEVSLS